MSRSASSGTSAPPSGFRGYSEYADQEADWLRAIPVHWRPARLKYLFTVKNGATPKSSEPRFWGGDIPWVTPEDLGGLEGTEILNPRRFITAEGYRSCGTTLVPAGSLVLSARAPIGHLAIAGTELCTNQGCKALVPKTNSDTRYFYYQLIAARPELRSRGQGSTFDELSREHLSTVVLADPPVPEQIVIRKFLDRQTRKIDELVSQKERVTWLLQEKRTALITRAVTRGLDPNVPMKDSGVKWLGEIPANWKVKPLKYLTKGRLQNGLFKKKEAYGSGTLLINVFDIYQERFQVDEGKLERVQVSLDEEKKYGVRAGDVFFVRSSLKLEGVGRSAASLEPTEATVFECHLVRARPNQELVRTEFLIHFLNSPPAVQRLVSLANTVTMSTLPQQSISSLEIALPTVEEQAEIMRSLAERLNELDALTRKIGEGIKRLRELRTSLISAAATGKIDVREEAT